MSVEVMRHYFESYDGLLIIAKHRYFYSLMIVCLFFLLRKFVVTRLFHFLSKRLAVRLNNANTNIRAEIIQRVFDAITYSLRNIFFLIGLLVAVYIAQLGMRTEAFLIDLFKSGILFYIGYAIYKALVAIQEDDEQLYQLFQQRFDKILIDFSLKAIIGLVVVTTGLLIMQEWGFQVSTFIAGLGLGGLAVALAAKDMVANIFAGFVVITDKPYSIGDWIETPTCEGTVEEITFRSTKVRTFAQALVTVPNAKLIDGAVTNWSRMGKRRVTFSLRVTCTTSIDKLKAVRERIEQMLQTHPDIHKEVIFVRFNEFADSSFNIFIYYFTTSTVWGEYLRVREDTFLKMLDILQSENVKIAIPAQTIYMENDAEDRIKKDMEIT